MNYYNEHDPTAARAGHRMNHSSESDMKAEASSTLPLYLSLGAGVQSSTMALMFAVGDLQPMPEAAIFSDTQGEPPSVYRWLDWLEARLPYPVHRVTAGSLADRATEMRRTKDGRLFSKSDIPVFTLSADGKVGKVPQRSCTRDFKIAPILKTVRKLAGVKRGTKEPAVQQAIGISADEFRRAKASREQWITNRFPLIEKRMTRLTCLEWMRSRGYPEPPRSSCVYCPFHRDEEWRRLQVEEPEAFAEAVAFEKRLQEAKAASANFSSVPYLHRSCKPLDTIDFRSDVERGQMLMWDDECEGMCGV